MFAVMVLFTFVASGTTLRAPGDDVSWVWSDLPQHDGPSVGRDDVVSWVWSDLPQHDGPSVGRSNIVSLVWSDLPHASACMKAAKHLAARLLHASCMPTHPKWTPFICQLHVTCTIHFQTSFTPAVNVQRAGMQAQLHVDFTLAVLLLYVICTIASC